MFKEISMMLYKYILDAEMIFLELYKINPFEILRQMPLMDLPMYIKQIQKNKEKERKQVKNSTITAALKAICDYLNIIFYRDKR